MSQSAPGGATEIGSQVCASSSGAFAHGDGVPVELDAVDRVAAGEGVPVRVPWVGAEVEVGQAPLYMSRLVNRFRPGA
jgi:hypothetical protein